MLASLHGRKCPGEGIVDYLYVNVSGELASLGEENGPTTIAGLPGPLPELVRTIFTTGIRDGEKGLGGISSEIPRM